MAIEKTCPVSGETFVVTDDDLAFYEKLGVPAPSLHPRERLRRRISYRNFRSLYHRTCDKTGENIISMYHAEQPFPVYKNDAYWADDWDPMAYGRDYDPNRSFLEQCYELACEVPRSNIMNISSENCQYSNMVMYSKDCYLVFGCVYNESCLYGHIVWMSEYCVDCLYAYRCQWCSNSVDIVDCYNTHYSIESYNCNDCYFLRDCRGCKNCFCCANLRNAEYRWFNEQLTKEEYNRRLSELQPFTHEFVTEYWDAVCSHEDKS